MLESKIASISSAGSLLDQAPQSTTHPLPRFEQAAKKETGRKEAVYRWLDSYGLKHRHQVPHHCHEAHIQHGYRPSPSSVCYCLKSMFHPTNETLNIWTHGIPCLLLLLHFHQFAQENFSDWADPLLYPFWFFASGVIFTLVGSTCAHIFNCLSVGAREACFCCDYSTIAIHSMGLAAVFTYYVCPYGCVYSNSNISFVMYMSFMIGNVLCMVSACLTRYPNVAHKNCLRVFPYVILFFFLLVPCIYKYFVSPTLLTDAPQGSSACLLPVTPLKKTIFLQICFFLIIGAIVHAYKMPERFWPGSFDIVGHSHQIFHLATALGLYYQSRLVEENLLDLLNLQKSGKVTPADLSISAFSSLGIPMMTSLLSCILALHYAADLYKMRFKEV